MIAAAANRIWNSPTAWYWAFSLLRVGAGVILLPLLNKLLSKEDLGMHTLFTSLYMLVMLLDTVFGPTLSRMIGYAMGGAKELKAFGVGEAPAEGGQPNFLLVAQIMQNAVRLYRVVLLPLTLGLALYGTWVIYARVDETTSPQRTWLAWAILLIAAPLEFYTGVWALFLRSMNEVLLSARLLTVIYTVKFLASVALLLAGFGLLSIPVATLLTALVQRALIRGPALRKMPPEAKNAPWLDLWSAVWPTSWRTGVQLLSGYLALTSLSNIVSRAFGLGQQAEFGISFQIIGSIMQTMAAMWLFVKWPLVTQLRARRAHAELRALMRVRIWRQLITFIALFLLLLALGPTVITWLHIQQNLLPMPLLCLMALWIFLEMHTTSWTTFLATENRIPSLWPVTIGNVLTILLAVGLPRVTDWEMGAIIAAPLISGALFNYWYWPRAGARNVGCSWTRLMFGRF